MPKIFLKPGSAEFADEPQTAKHRLCERAGCPYHAEHKAPKHRGLNEYYHFCLDHVREYNKAWNFFAGMSDEEVFEHQMSSAYGDRPTWRYDAEGTAEDNLKRKAWQTYTGQDETPEFEERKNGHHHHFQHMQGTPEFEALAIMDLQPPITLPAIKERYKALAKKYHPDLNKGCTESENRLKSINMAYTILKCAYEQFEILEQKD